MMKILFIARLFYPHIGGVEKHIYEVAEKLNIKGNSVTILTEKYDKKLKNAETVDTIKVVRFSYPHVKLVGLIFIYWQLFKNRKLIEKAEIVHVHDVFIWYLLFKLIYPNKKVYMTFHGWEEIWPIPWKNIILKQIASKLSDRNITVGEYVHKYYRIKTNKVIYGAATVLRSNVAKSKNAIVYVGRLEKNTGLLEFLKYLDKNKQYTVDFCGDGPLREQCEKYGTVHGFTDPTPFLKKAEYCVPGGYLAALEGLAANCELKLFWNNKIKEDYWKMSPFYKLTGKELTDWAKQQTWEKLADEYLKLYDH